MIGIRLAAAVAALMVVCLPSVALAQETNAQNLIEATIASWGTWTVVAGNLLALGIYVWRLIKPEVWERIHPRLKRVIPPTVAALATVSGALIAGASWAEAGQTLIAVWGGALITQDVLTGLFKPAPPVPTLEAAGVNDVMTMVEQQRTPKRRPPLTPVAIVLVALGSTGCTKLQSAAEATATAIDAACTIGLVDAVAVQVSAADRGIPVDVLAELLCSVPEVYEAWELAQGQRMSQATAAVLRARELGLL